MKKYLSFFLALLLTISLAAYSSAAECCETSATYWYYYEDCHYGFCIVCGATKVERSPHEFVDGACTVCHFKPCADGKHTPGEYNPHECGGCLMLSDCYDSNGDGLCELCGEKACPCDEWTCVPFEDGCRQQCTKCGNWVSEKMSHCFDLTIGPGCLSCGAQCLHTNILWEFTPDEHFARCFDCWTVIAEWEPHNIADGECTVCPLGGCDHADKKYNLSYNNIGHDACCAMCNELVIPWSPHEYDAEGICKICSFVGCTHGTLEEAKDIRLEFNDQEHWYVCNLCEYAYTDLEAHQFIDGACSICGAHLCANGDHTADSALMPHRCQKCNAIVPCIDKNYNCFCDYCNSECHTLTLETTQTQHRASCRFCGFVGEWFDHYEFDGLVGCDYCEYGKPKAEEKVEIAEDVPTTKVDISIDTLLTEEEKSQAANGISVEVTLNIQNADGTITAEEQAAVTAVIEQAESEQTVALYLDIDLSKTIGDQAPAAITETEKMITIMISIPPELQLQNRSFSVIRVHNGVATELPDLDDNPATVTIQTDRFSTYALVYSEQEADTDTPSGGESNDGGSDSGIGNNEADKAEDNQPDIPAQQQPCMSWILIAGVGGILIVAAAVIAVILGKKKR